jgi:hypothetical protein
MRADLALLSGCVSGAAGIEQIHGLLAAAGFEQISIRPKDGSRDFIREWAPGRSVEDYVVSAMIEAVRP